MSPLGRKRFLELAAVIGLSLLPFAWHALEGILWRWATGGHEPDWLIRMSFAISVPLDPGTVVARLMGNMADILDLTTNWRLLDRVTDVLSPIMNVLVWVLTWFAMRVLPKGSQRREATKLAIAVWFVFAVPIGILGSLLMVLS